MFLRRDEETQLWTSLLRNLDLETLREPYFSHHAQGGACRVSLQPQLGRQAPRRHPVLHLHHRLQGCV